MADIVISGYHGFANSGDEALLFAILNTLRSKKPDLDVTVLSKTPESTAIVYGVKSIYRYNLFKVIKEMKSSDENNINNIYLNYIFSESTKNIIFKNTIIICQVFISLNNNHNMLLHHFLFWL